jgi:sirohydrochlorin cobaltochelatase
MEKGTMMAGTPLEDATKAAVILVAFGASDPEARKVYDYIDVRAKSRFPGYAVSWAFTSAVIRKKLAQRGTRTACPAEAIKEAHRQGHGRVVLQSLHVVPGQEYLALQRFAVSDGSCSIGDALLTSERDIDETLQALRQEIVFDAANVVVAHGNDRFPKLNRQVLAFAQRIEAAHPRVWVCSVEGQPGTAHLESVRRAAEHTGRVHFIPLMLVAGEHIQSDVMGDEPDSWKQRVGASAATCSRPLGYNDRVLDIYFRHLEAALTCPDVQPASS